MASTVVVTGASGFVAAHVVKELLEKGYKVRGTVRSLDNKEKTAFLVALGNALPGTLELHEADLLKDGSFDDVIRGAKYVFHTASPFFGEADDPQKELVDPALKGTKNVLASVVKHKKTVKRVVLTSSLVAMLKMDKGPDNPPRYTEKEWNTESTLDKDPYMLSKTVAEKAAWEIVEKEGLDMVSIHPGFVCGPLLSSRPDGTSVKSVTSILQSQDIFLYPWWSDVRDIARAQARAAEKPSAKGRYLVVQPETVNYKHLTDVLSEAYPQFKFKPLEDKPSEPAVDSFRALKELDLGTYIDPFESIIDMAAGLIEKGIAKPQKA